MPTDMMMRVMKSPEIIRKVLEVNLLLSIILASGFDTDGRLGYDSHVGIRDFLTKPNTAGTLQSSHE